MRAIKVWFEDANVCIETSTQQIGKMPLTWFPRLNNANASERQNYELWDEGTWIHWENLQEDLSAEGFFAYSKLNTRL